MLAEQVSCNQGLAAKTGKTAYTLPRSHSTWQALAGRAGMHIRLYAWQANYLERESLARAASQCSRSKARLPAIQSAYACASSPVRPSARASASSASCICKTRTISLHHATLDDRRRLPLSSVCQCSIMQPIDDRPTASMHLYAVWLHGH